jgi:hypothetical protein
MPGTMETGTAGQRVARILHHIPTVAWQTRLLPGQWFLGTTKRGLPSLSYVTMKEFS